MTLDFKRNKEDFVCEQCGFAVAVANARAQVKTEAHYVTPNSGGTGAARDAVEFILEAKGEDKGGFSAAEMNFQMGLGQLMARMTDPNKKYGIAFPATPDFIKALQKFEHSFAFKALDVYLFVANGDKTYFVVPPADIPAYIQNNRI